MNNKNQQFQRRRPRQARAQQKYNAVLDACTQVLDSKGYRKTTILELSLESGVAVPTIYQYFAHKEDIFRVWMDRVIKQILLLVSNTKAAMQHQNISTYVDDLMLTALLAFKHYRSSIQQLLTGTPDALSSQMVASMENKTVAMLIETFADELAQIEDQDFEFKLRMLVKMINGYLLQSVINNETAIAEEKEAMELATIVKLYLGRLGIV